MNNDVVAWSRFSFRLLRKGCRFIFIVGLMFLSLEACSGPREPNTPNPLTPAVVTESRIAASSDDAEEYATRTVNRTSGKLELTQSSSKQTVGLRFANLTIPKGATISKAYLQFKTASVSSEATLLMLQGQASDHAPTFSSTNSNVSSRPRTTAAITWSPVVWSLVGEAGLKQQTPALTSIIQAIVNRPGWASGNALALIITGTGRRVAWAYDGDPASAPLLHVEYTSSVPAITVALRPSSATLTTSQSTSFSATVSGSSNTAVTWQASGGTVTGTGNTVTYKAPATTGTYTLTATSVANTTKKASATITVTSSTAPTVTFAAAGDFGGRNNRAGTVMNDLKTRSAKAFLLLGDMSYDEIVPESAWCAWVHSYLGATYPLELIAGNHEEDSRVDGHVRNFTACMPDRLASSLGPGGYGVNYAFDLGVVTVVAVAPKLTVDGVAYSYGSGSAELSWLLSQVRAAKSEGDWVVVGMHKNCVTIGNKSCEIGQAFAQLLINEKVDLVLQGHDHDYQRSHALAKVQANTVPAGAIADNGSDKLYARGAGTVFVITGTVGRGLTACSHIDSEYGYFATHHCAEESASTVGYLLMTASSTQLEARFIATVGTYADTFTIR
jgi:Calcineurin-like phosphoesterase